MVGVVVGIDGLCWFEASAAPQWFAVIPGGLGAVRWSPVSVVPLWFAVAAMSPRRPLTG